MRRVFVALAVLLVVTTSAHARGFLIPTDKKLPPLTLIEQKVTIHIDDQVAVTRIEQTFRNHTNRQLEATYFFPVPKGASVRKFSMWVGGKEETGELVEAAKAREIYNNIVRRTLDPGLLEYMTSNLFKLRVFPVPANGDQKIALSYTSLADSESGLIEYAYPLRGESMAGVAPDRFSLVINLKSQHPITNIYSPSHPINIGRPSENEATIGINAGRASFDRDFQLLYQAAAKDIGLTAVTHRPNGDQNGHFMLLLSPRTELARGRQMPRDFVLVLDTSGSMNGKRIVQARNALKYCLKNLGSSDRFTMINFATTVNKYNETLLEATDRNIAAAERWVDGLEATGGTAIDDALKAALAMRPRDEGRTFTVIFFTDGQPTVGECIPSKILDNVSKVNSGNTRIFSFGVGDDVNTVLLDALADTTKAISTYVRETEDIEAKVSGLYSKISNPVLANLKLTVGDGVTLNEVYPPHLPDLFHGSQLVVFGRYQGSGKTTVKLTGNAGREIKEFVYRLDFPEQTGTEKAFVEDLWARRKVGFMIDQIRAHGESKELVQEVVTLAKRYGIATPYTSYLFVPDNVARPIVRGAKAGGGGGFGGGQAPPALQNGNVIRGALKTDEAMKLADFAKGLNKGVETERARQDGLQLKEQAKLGGKDEKEANKAIDAKNSLQLAGNAFKSKQLSEVQQGKLGVDFALQNSTLRFQEQMTSQRASRTVQNRNCIDVGGVWIDDGFDPKMETVSVKSMSDAYFRILDRHPAVREVFQLGNYVVWVTPSGKALVIDGGAGAETLADSDIDRLFVAGGKGGRNEDGR